MSGNQSLRLRWRVIAGAALAVLLVAFAGGLATEIGPWYLALKQPAWKPPDWLFGPAWMLIYGSTATAAVLAWEAGTDPAVRRTLLLAFGLNGVLNVLWSLLFFTIKRPDWAFGEVLLLWLSIVLLLRLVHPLSRRAAWLLVPYLAWVTFAATLNLAVVRLNAPFGGA
ncbi:MAG TPA: TspO/MBR family protein [Burkholderiaceae bacterium]|nr:TspO/MBR family protein [Burkholderiaceae bacterium]